MALEVQIAESITVTVITGVRSGSVMRKYCWNGVAPSMAAAS
jgi:hypothetical protein